MTEILNQLVEDHKHLDRVLDVFDYQLYLLAEGKDPDLEILLDCTEYIQHYSDLVHHPKEDQLFAHFSQLNDKHSEIIDTLTTQHKKLPSLTVELHMLLDGALNGAIFVSKDELHQKIQKFSEAQKNHMKLENQMIFPLIKETFGDEDWKALEENIISKEDPLFGMNLERQYQNLYQSIQEQSIMEQC